MKKIPLRQVCIISWTLYALAILLILLGWLLRLFWLIAAALVVMVAAIVFLAIFNRCPRCSRFLGHAGGLRFAHTAGSGWMGSCH